MPRLVVVSNNVPSSSMAGPPGTVTAALQAALQSDGGIWFGWDGKLSPVPRSPTFSKAAGAGYSLATIPLTPKEYHGYYEQHANRALWPLLHSRIDDLTAYGSTAGALGTAWSWYSLSPKWSSIFPASSVPGSYQDVTTLQGNGAPVLRKVAVMMSDGVYNTWRGWKGQSQQAVSNYAKQLCTNMKAKGIKDFQLHYALETLARLARTQTATSAGIRKGSR